MVNAEKNIIVTAALPYIHGMPHLGNVTALLPADVYYRYLKMKKLNAIFVCGSDSHGTMFELAAEKLGITPKELVYKNHDAVKSMLEKFNFNFSHYGITDHEFNKQTTEFFFKKLHERGYIIENEEKHPFCKSCNKFLADRWIEGTCPHCEGIGRGDQCDDCGKLLNPEEIKDPYCVHCTKKEIEFRLTKHLLFDLSKFESKLEEWIKTKEWSPNVKNYTLGWLNNGLKARTITRDATWGFKVPLEGFDQKVFYVWFDAVLGYISITKEWAEKEGKNWEDWWKGNTELIQFMGKDNVPFHTIIWPSMLMGVNDNYILPTDIVSSEYLTYKKGKFSKSRGVGLTTLDALKHRPADYWRYCMIALYPDIKDSEFSLELFQEKINKELIGNFGNFVHRTLSFINNNYDGNITDDGVKDNSYDDILKRIEKVESLISEYKFKEALATIVSISSIGNEIFQKSEPWKDPQSPESRMILKVCANMCKALAVVSSPFLPDISQNIWQQLGLSGNVSNVNWDESKNFDITGKIGKSKVLLKKIDASEVTEWKSKYEKKERKGDKEMVSFDQFSKIDIRIGEVKEAQDLEGSDKLFKLNVNIGEETRQCVAGIRDGYKKEDLIGKKVVVIVNLEPATIRGVKSECMLLATEEGKVPILLGPDKDVKVGSKVR